MTSAAGLAAAASAAGPGAAAAVDSEPGGFKLGVASYSFREFQRVAMIRQMKELEIPYLSIKEFHLPYSSSPEEFVRARKEFDAAGLKIVSGGVITLAKNDEADVRKYFEYAKAAGMPMIVCAPTHDNVRHLDKLTKEYGIRAAIHNHGPEDKNFPSPQSVLEAIKDLNPMVGLCMDIGHSSRAGADILASIRQAGSRLIEVHIKDLKVATDAGSLCAVGDGVLPIVPMFQLLRKTGFTGCVNLEYEIHADTPLPGMLKSFGYMRGVLAGLKG